MTNTIGSYWDIDAIMTEESRIPVHMTSPPPKALAVLLDANSSGEIKELPLWMAKGLKQDASTSECIQTQMPKAYSNRSLQKMQAGATSVPLGQRHAYFYDLGAEVSLLDKTQQGIEVMNTLGSAFAERWKDIFDRFHNTEDKGASKFLAKLTRSEQALYHSGKESCLHHSNWRRRQMEVIEESHISRMTKRQRS